MKILISKFNMIGDVVLSSVVVKNIKKKWPDAEITFTTYESNRSVLEHNPFISHIHTFQKLKSGVVSKLFNNIRFFIWFIKNKHDIYICLRECSRARFLGLLSRSHIRVSNTYTSWLCKLAYHHIAESDHPHAVEKDLAVLKVLDCKIDHCSPESYWNNKRKGVLDELLPLTPYVQLHPGSRWSYKEIPEESCAQLVRKISDLGLEVVITGSGDQRECDKNTRIEELSKRPVINLSGQVEISDLAYISQRAVLYVGADTAAMHIAASVNTPVVSWFGPSLTANWGPWDGEVGESPYENHGGVQSMGRHRVVQMKKECVPCDQRGCDHSGRSECLENLDMKEVIEEIERVLALNTSD